MSTLTDPTSSTPPGEPIDTGPLAEELARAEHRVTLAAETYLRHLDPRDDLHEWALDGLRTAVAAATEADAAWSAAVDHNARRRLTAQQGIAEARRELAAGVARGYQTRAEADEARAEDRHHRDLEELEAARDAGWVA